MPMWMFMKALRALGISPFEQLGIRTYIQGHRRGAFELGAPNDHVLEATGRTPEDFGTVVSRYAALPGARRNLHNFLRACSDFIRIGFTRPHDLDRFEREQLHPVPTSRRLAIEYDRWPGHDGQQACATLGPVGE